MENDIGCKLIFSRQKISVYYIPKHLDKSGFYQFIQLVQLLPALGNQVADLVQYSGNFALFIKRRKRNFIWEKLRLGKRLFLIILQICSVVRKE